jgi:hypothetical protein
MMTTPQVHERRPLPPLGAMLLLLAVAAPRSPLGGQEPAPSTRRFDAEAHLPSSSLFHLHVPSGRKLIAALGDTLPGRILRDEEVHAALGRLPEGILGLVRQETGPLAAVLGRDPLEALSLLEGELVLSITGLDPLSFVSVVAAIELGTNRAAILDVVERLARLGLHAGAEPRRIPLGGREATLIATGGPPIHFLVLGEHLVLSLSRDVLDGIIQAFDGKLPAGDLCLKDNEAFRGALAKVETAEPRLRLVVHLAALRSLVLGPPLSLGRDPEAMAIARLSGLTGVDGLAYGLGARGGDVEGKLHLALAPGKLGLLGAALEGIAAPPMGGRDALLALAPAATRSLSAIALEPGKMLRGLHAALRDGLPDELWSEVAAAIQGVEARIGLSLERDLFTLGRIDLLSAEAPPPGGSFVDDLYVFVKTEQWEPLRSAIGKLGESLGRPAQSLDEGGRRIEYVRIGSLASRLLFPRGELPPLDDPEELLRAVLPPPIAVAAVPLDDGWTLLSLSPQPLIRYLRYHARGDKLSRDSALARLFLEAPPNALASSFRPGGGALAAYNTFLALLPARVQVPLPFFAAELEPYKLPPAEKFFAFQAEGFHRLTVETDGITLHGHRVLSGSFGSILLTGGALAAGLGF